MSFIKALNIISPLLSLVFPHTIIIKDIIIEGLTKFEEETKIFNFIDQVTTIDGLYNIFFKTIINSNNINL